MRHSIAILLLVLLSFAASKARAQPAEPAAPKNAEPPPGSQLVPIKNKWSVTLGGFFQADAIYDTTQGFLDNSGGTAIPRPGTYAGDHDRTTYTIRNSRFGLRLVAPEVDRLLSSAYVEFDFFGNQPGVPPAITETAFFSGPGVRMRHLYLKLESPYVDLLVGQTWHLFGWQPLFAPNTAALQGVPGQLFTRSAQIRLSHAFKTAPVNLEVAAAAVRPAQRDSATPDGQAGLLLAFNGLKAFHVNGNGGPQAVDALRVGLSGVVRRFRVAEFTATPASSNKATGWAVSLDALVPVIPVTSDNHGNKLTVSGSFQTGTAFADQYLAFTGGVTFPPLPAPPGATAAAYPNNVDPGQVTYDSAGQLHTIDWTVFLVGLQYYLPPSGKIWMSANFSQMKSGNIASFNANPQRVFTKEQWGDVCLFWQVTAPIRFGIEYDRFTQTYADGVVAPNHRGQFTGWFSF